ncbi:hypothetical protein CSC94_16545 [Zhengella mangrovi]|uniref:B12-binding domain-containing protein n=1 Tax=Zhengella mangrovi TaxID=1982044 RepID=A0A2G1QK67_9HYPH|nr:cobalamin-dependent protein [Zhengella mangrovi]PHP65927.1 hypothetical protein CSC94_16545 [Zhengella mangrovi]
MTSSLPLTAPGMQPGTDLLAAGRSLAGDWRLGGNLFLASAGVASEAEYKRQAMRDGRMMQHAHIGFRSIDRTVDAIRHLHETADRQGVRIDRFGITLDWSMGYPPERRAGASRGTGIVLTGPEDFRRITDASPAAAHFGDFMLGLPGALHNTQAALAAGATAIGNLGQYFTFRLPYWDDDVAMTEATVTALGLIAAQNADILVHSNLDDGFAGLFLDMTSAFGMMLIEKHIVEDLVGARASFCFGHHFSRPLARAAFHAAMAAEVETPGTMLFGNTVAYRGAPAANFASLASYLLADIVALQAAHTGHAINPVPVTENQRIPDVDEILDAQCFAARLAEHAAGHGQLWDRPAIDTMAQALRSGGHRFAAAVLAGLAGRGVDTGDPAALMLAIRRLGPKRIEALWGQGRDDGERRAALIPADWAEELDAMADSWVRKAAPDADALRHLRVVIGTTDVHEHGAYLVRQALEQLGVAAVDAGTAVDPEVLVARACEEGADAIAISTYNGIALTYVRAVRRELARRGATIAVMAGGKLNQIPEDTNSGLPRDVREDIRQEGAVPCSGLDDMLAVLRDLSGRGDGGSKT